MKIENFMTSEVISVDLDDRLALVQELFNKNKFHHLLVVDSTNKLVAVISERDLLKAISPNINLPSATAKDIATLNKRVHQVVSRKLTKIYQFSSLAAAVKLFKEEKVSCLPVVNNDNVPVGIITWRDILDWLYNKLPKSETENAE